MSDVSNKENERSTTLLTEPVMTFLLPELQVATKLVRLWAADMSPWPRVGTARSKREASDAKIIIMKEQGKVGVVGWTSTSLCVSKECGC